MAKAATATPKQVETPQNQNSIDTIKTGTALAASSLEDMAGDGLENVTGDDLLVPRIAIIQSSSDQIKPKKAVYIAGAKIGDICNIGTGELFEAPLIFLPVHFMKVWLEWNGDMGAGLAAIHNTPDILDECERDDDGKYFTKKDGHPVQESAQFLGLNISGGGMRCFIGLKSSELKKSKKWLTLSTSEKLIKIVDGKEVEYTPALFYRTYELSVVEEGNSKGDWVGWKIERGQKLEELPNWQRTFEEVKKFRASIKRGEIRSDVGSMADEDTSDKAM